jgi:hypothetical protein
MHVIVADITRTERYLTPKSLIISRKITATN